MLPSRRLEFQARSINKTRISVTATAFELNSCFTCFTCFTCFACFTAPWKLRILSGALAGKNSTTSP